MKDTKRRAHKKLRHFDSRKGPCQSEEGEHVIQMAPNSVFMYTQPLLSDKGIRVCKQSSLIFHVSGDLFFYLIRVIHFYSYLSILWFLYISMGE